MTDADLETLVAELAADGIVVTKEEARRAVYRLAELLLLISQPLPLPPSSHRGESREDPLRAPGA